MQQEPAPYQPNHPVQQPQAAGYIQPATGRDDTALVVCAWIVAAITFGYMLPWAVAVQRKMPNHFAIGMINFFTGWTLVGWFAALFMACTNGNRMAGGGNQNTVVQVYSNGGGYPQGYPQQYPPQQYYSHPQQ